MKLRALTFLFTLLLSDLSSGSELHGRNTPGFPKIKLNRAYTQLQEQYGHPTNVKTAMGLLQDAAFLGLMKSYKINSKLQGTFLVAYNFFNDKTKISSPWIIRLGWKL